MLVELKLVEQRYQAVREVLEGSQVTDVAVRYGVVRQTVHTWLRRYASDGMAGLVNQSSKPARCPHQMAANIEAMVVEMRGQNPSWGPRRIVWQLTRSGITPPGRSSVYRALVRHGLIDPQKRARRRSDYRRWERHRAMELWQMDVMGRVRLEDRTELSVVTGIDDHSRFCVIARLVRRATAQPVCEALLHGLRTHGVPEAILTDNGKVFTGRFTLAASPVRFDRICRENGIRHLLTAPYSPTTTGKIERLHKTMRAELFDVETFATIEEAQEALDRWVDRYNTDRPHQSIGDVPPIERFRLAQTRVEPADDDLNEDGVEEQRVAVVPPAAGVTRWVDPRGEIVVASVTYHVGREFSGEHVDVVVRNRLVEISHRGVVVATLAQRRVPGAKEHAPLRLASPHPRPATAGLSVTRLVDRAGCIYFAGVQYRAGNAYRGREVQVAVVAGSVQISDSGEVIRVHAARHDPAKEHGAFAVPHGRPRVRDRPGQSA